MSGLAGVFHVDGRPADPALLARMTASLAHRGPDGEGQWIDGPIGLGHRLLATTPESVSEKQPASDEVGECRLVWDGRLDNRRELIAMLRVGADALTWPDAQLVLLAYQRWGSACFARLIGDFALALWDARPRTLLCARDPFGVRPLYYHWDGARLAFASEVEALFADPTLLRRPDEATIADYLLMGFRDPDRTFFDGVRQLRPAHVLRLDDRGLRLERYWDAEPSRELRYAREDDYLDEFRDLFREALRCRLRSTTPVGLLLSGGVDSTLVAATAEALRRDEGLGIELPAFTLLIEGFLQEEWEAVQGLMTAYGTELRTIAVEPGRNFLELYLESPEPPDHEGIPVMPAVLRSVAARGCRVLMTGVGADELSRRAEIGFIEDLLGAWRLPDFLRHVRERTLSYADGAWVREAGAVLWSRLPGSLRHAVKRLTGRQVPSWLEPGFARRAGIGGWRLPEGQRRFATWCAEATYRALTRPDLASALGHLDARAGRFTVECRHPYLDRRLVEFFLAVPADVKLGHGYRKQFVQRALAGAVPGPLRTTERQDEHVRHDEPTFVRQDAARMARDLFHPRARVFRYVDRAGAERMRDAYVGRGRPHGTLLWNFLSLEVWLQQVFPEWPDAGAGAG